MARTYSLLRSAALGHRHAETRVAAHEIVGRANAQLSLRNPSCMFVTLFLGILNMRTGQLQFCNAGHLPPYILGADGSVRASSEMGGMAIGFDEEAPYTTGSAVLIPGDAVFIYTDGITEAMDVGSNLFSDQRLADALQGVAGLPVRDIVESVISSVKAFAGAAPQSDDIAALALRWLPA
jgi:sigma-B regulation protein RsbU (phosphoserine phosphatase)